MESCNRTQQTDRLWPYLIAAAIGTFLIAFVPSDAWLGGWTASGAALSASFTKQLLTVLLLCVVPSVWARLAYRTTPWFLLGLTVFAFGCGLVVSGDAGDALYTAALAALPGAGLYGLLRLKQTNFRTVIYESFVILAALFVFVCLRDLIRTGNAYASYQAVVGLYGQEMTRIAGTGDALGGLVLKEEAEAIIDLFRSNAEAYCVQILLLPAMAAALSNTLFSHLFNRSGGADLVPLPPFREWRCERGYVLLNAGFLLATMFLGFAGVQAASALSGVAALLWRMPCMLGGLCAVRRLGFLSGRNWVFWAAVVMLILLPPATGMVLSLLGLLAALRKPKNVGEDGERK